MEHAPTSQDLLSSMDFPAVIRVDKIGHGGDLGVVLVPRIDTRGQSFSLLRRVAAHPRLRLLTVEWIDLVSDEHMSQDKVLQHLDPLGRASFVIILE